MDKYKGKTLSILGDSISTYTNYSNGEAAKINKTIINNHIYYYPGRYGVYLEDTWWMQVINKLGFKLLLNNSWSGSCIYQTRSETEGAYISRCTELHNDQTLEEPEYILIFLGTNDFGMFYDLNGDANIDYDTLVNPTTTCEAYAIMLSKIKKRYPNAKVYCMGLLAREYKYNEILKFNKDLESIINHYGYIYIDLFDTEIKYNLNRYCDYIVDGVVHPSKLGMKIIADKVIEVLLNK
ncbi:MAG: hypothetical protein IJ966_04405 [Bacilli bacterium]|nr:hypothetical protein [Bacilli bacterium]